LAEAAISAYAAETSKPYWVNPTEGVITSAGGLRTNPVSGLLEFHDGIDIACPVGTAVFATRDGTVLSKGWSPSLGNYLRLSLDGGYTALYAHLDRVTVSPHETVAQGQKVAYSGNTGRSTGPHLHYGVFREGQYINPGPLVSLPARSDLALVEP
jgi:murein DD-endopeptidase MepM/ murein hydrolase activator NlpD